MNILHRNLTYNLGSELQIKLSDKNLHVLTLDKDTHL